MARDVFYRQCRIVKRIDGGEWPLRQVSWLPEPYAAAGRILKPATTTALGRRLGSGRRPPRRLRQDQVPDFHELVKAHRRRRHLLHREMVFKRIIRIKFSGRLLQFGNRFGRVPFSGRTIR